MRKTTDRNFNKRFGDRISMVFADKPLPPAEQKAQSNALYRTIREVMAGILGREPTDAEICGSKDISERRGGRNRPVI